MPLTRSEANGVVTYRDELILWTSRLVAGSLAMAAVAGAAAAATHRELIGAVVVLVISLAIGWAGWRERVELRADHLFVVRRNGRWTFAYEQLRDPVFQRSGSLLIASRYGYVEVPATAELQQELRERMAVAESPVD